MSSERRPQVVILGGPNEAGRSTVAPTLLKGALRVSEFVNADAIAQGLSGFNPAGAAVEAARIMLRRMRHLADLRSDFAFEATLAGRSWAHWIGELLALDYGVHVVFLWLPTADLAVQRVADRVRMGGHDVPEETVRRRYARALTNLASLYLPMASAWGIFDNSKPTGPRLVVSGEGRELVAVMDWEIWHSISGPHSNDFTLQQH